MRAFSAVALGLIVCLAGVELAARQAPVAPRPPMAEDVFKNIQVLKGIPVDEFMGTMGFFSSSLGLNCTDCHVEESGGSWARYADDNALKQRTRVMMVMMNTINRTNFGGRQVVTCNTCHRGNARPNVMPSLNLLYGEPPPDEPGDPFEQAPGQPAADQVLDRFIAAIGGAQRVAALTSFAAKGTYIGFDDADKAPMEMFARAPGRRATIVHGLSGETIATFDGRNGWIAAPPTDRPVPLLTLTGQELEGVRLEAQLLFPSRIKESLTRWRVGVPALLDDREVRVVQGNTAGGGVATLCFDAETGLLVRLVRYANSPVGRLVTRVDYDDYRDVAGVRMPFRWTVRWLSGRSTYELTEVQPNVQVAETRFARPGL
ncbi:MAG: photosynthetic reaction center cytochrome c subunit family protein [Vicinamibacterales bacterium]